MTENVKSKILIGILKYLARFSFWNLKPLHWDGYSSCPEIFLRSCRWMSNCKKIQQQLKCFILNPKKWTDNSEIFKAIGVPRMCKTHSHHKDRTHLWWSHKLINRTLTTGWKKKKKKHLGYKVTMKFNYCILCIIWNLFFLFIIALHDLTWGRLFRSPPITTGMSPHSCDSSYALSRKIRTYRIVAYMQTYYLQDYSLHANVFL